MGKPHGFAHAAADRYLRTRQAAQYLGIANSTLIAWRRARRGPPPIRVSVNRTLYDVRALDAFMESRKQSFEPSATAAAEQPTAAVQSPVSAESPRP